VEPVRKEPPTVKPIYLGPAMTSGELVVSDPAGKSAKPEPTDPHVTLMHYQQAIPATMKAAAIALETELLEQQQKREAQLQAGVANARPV